ncbi:MAG: hypothetical protein PHO79_07860 [Desulfoplanes sp.]|nr:hypothetical protein [Desulfoplanes sp.]
MLNLKNVRTFIILLAASALLCLAGCRTAPVYNVVDAPVLQSANHPIESPQVKKAILQAGTSLGWHMGPTTPGHITGTLNLRSHKAVVDILYSNKDYSITYKNSYNLRYDGTNIHKNYNGWIQRLDKQIRLALLNIN